MAQSIKCHKCRTILVENMNIVINNTLCDPKQCDSYDIKKFIYLPTDNVPEWIISVIEKNEWTKGKLHCVKCGYRVGAFDFVSGKKCSCKTTLIPSVHLVTSQVDRPIKVEVN